LSRGEIHLGAGVVVFKDDSKRRLGYSSHFDEGGDRARKQKVPGEGRLAARLEKGLGEGEALKKQRAGTPCDRMYNPAWVDTWDPGTIRGVAEKEIVLR